MANMRPLYHVPGLSALEGLRRQTPFFSGIRLGWLGTAAYGFEVYGRVIGFRVQAVLKRRNQVETWQPFKLF